MLSPYVTMTVCLLIGQKWPKMWFLFFFFVCFSWRTEQRNTAGCRREPVRPSNTSSSSSSSCSPLSSSPYTRHLHFHSTGVLPDYPWVFAFLRRCTLHPTLLFCFMVLPTRSPVFAPHICKLWTSAFLPVSVTWLFKTFAKWGNASETDAFKGIGHAFRKNYKCPIIPSTHGDFFFFFLGSVSQHPSGLTLETPF